MSRQAEDTPELIIYTRRDCSLCGQMESGVRRITGPEARLAIVVVDDDPELVRRFGADVPVLCIDGEVICRHFLDAERLLAVLGQV